MPVPSGVPVFAVPTVPPPGSFVLDGAEGRHAASARRLRVGEELVLTDGKGSWAPGRVAAVGRGDLVAIIGPGRVEPSPALRVLIAQALPKGERSALAIELATEAGADGFVPWAAHRCVAQWVAERRDPGRERWQQVAIEAAKQSRRVWFPQVDRLHSTQDLIGRVSAMTTRGDTVIVLHEAESVPLRSIPLRASGELLVVVGPEGGITEEEMRALTDAGAQPARLGPEVLRTSTAATVALGALGVLARRWA